MVGVRLADPSSPSVVDVFAAGVCSLGSHKYRVGAEECLRLWRYLRTVGNLLSDQFSIAFDVVHLRTQPSQGNIERRIHEGNVLFDVSQLLVLNL